MLIKYREIWQYILLKRLRLGSNTFSDRTETHVPSPCNTNHDFVGLINILYLYVLNMYYAIMS